MHEVMSVNSPDNSVPSGIRANPRARDRLLWNPLCW